MTQELAAEPVLTSRARRFRDRCRELLYPWAGRALPADLRPRAVAGLAASLPEGVRDPALPMLLHRIDTGPIHTGNRVSVFTDGEEAFAAGGEAIESAVHEVLVESYIIRGDETGRRLLERLKRAVARGAAVRVLTDAVGSFNTPSSFWDEMRAAGIDVRLFHPLWTHWAQRNYRDHRKIMVIDRRVGFIGGMNIANEYGSSVGARADAWRDTHARLEGDVAQELAAVFLEGWTRADGPPFPVAPPPEPAERPGARVLVVDTRAGRGQREKQSVLAAIVGAARHRLLVTNAYFAPGRFTVDLLGAAARRGVDVRLLLPGRSDVPLLRHAGHGYYADLLRRGVRVFEYEAATLHAKTLVADDYVSLVGSSNLDARSFHYNAECNALVLDDDTGRALSESFFRDLECSREIRLEAWKKRGYLHRLADAAARRLTPFL
jgi:cardiolipin synthase A/B